MRTILLFWLAGLFASAAAQNGRISEIRQWRVEHEAALISEFMHFVSLPNTAADPENKTRNASYLAGLLKSKGVENVQLLETGMATDPPVVYGEVLQPGARHTILFYAHYDGQPVNAADWAKGLAPFSPVLYSAPIDQGGRPIDTASLKQYNPDWRIYGRGAADDKNGVLAILNAWQSIAERGLQPACNIKFFFEGEEEAGSPHLAAILQRYRDLLRSDLWIICDGSVHQSGRKQLVFGVRGDTHLDLTVYGPRRPLHSGHFGNWAPNPALELVQLLASMKDDRGRVRIRGFYDDVIPLSASEKQALASVPRPDSVLQRELGIARSEMTGLDLNESIQLPSLNINGIRSGNTGAKASNVIPTTATAVLDLRLVPGNDWRRQQQKVIEHIRRQGFQVLDREPTDEERMRYAKLIRVIPDEAGYNALRTPLNLPVARLLIAAVQQTVREPLILLPGFGGSLPLETIHQTLQASCIILPTANYDNNQHAENENLRIGNYWDGIESMASVMLMSW